jgi:DNA-binding NarL/FixJ family response regulator
MAKRSWRDLFRFGRGTHRRRFESNAGAPHEPPLRSTSSLLNDLLASILADRRTRRELEDHWNALTMREQQVVALICLGYTNRQIAARLGISVETIKSHVRNVLLKFRIHSKTDLRLMFSSWDFAEWDS